MARRFKKSETHRAHTNFIALMDGNELEFRGRTITEINACSGPGRKFVMAGNEVRMEVRFDYVPDRQPMLFGFVEIDLNIALRIDDCGFAA